MPKHDLSRIKVNTTVVDPLAEVDDQPEVDPAIAELRLRYYNPGTDDPISLEQLEKRIRKNADRINRLSVEMMFDLYFAHANWSGFYNRTDSFSSWLERTVDVSRSYAYDIIKVVRTMIEFVGESASSGETLRIEELGTRIERVGLKKMKLISQVRDEDTRFQFLQRVLSGEAVNDQDILRRNQELVAARRDQPRKNGERVQVSVDTVRGLVSRYEKELSTHGGRKENVLGGLQALSQAFAGTTLESEINAVLDMHR
jgi:hypothetical protein